MLLIAFLWIYLAVLSFSYGEALRRLLCRRIFACAPRSGLVTFLLGFAFLAWLSSLLALFVNLGLGAALAVAAGGCAAFLSLRLWETLPRGARLLRNLHPLVLALTLTGGLVTLAYAVLPPATPDTPMYHAQAIHWAETYPTVPGLGNLDVRQGSSSTWFTLNALFSFAFLGGQSFRVVPSFFFALVWLYLLSGLQSLLTGETHLSQIVKAGLLPFAFWILPREISSPGTDLPVILTYWLALALWLDALEGGDEQAGFAALLFALLAPTFKLSGAPLVLFVLWSAARAWRGGHYRRLGGLLGISLLVLLPWLARTFLLSGYWLFPLPGMEHFSPRVDWAVPPARAAGAKRAVWAWSISPRDTWEYLVSLSLLARIRLWMQHQTPNQNLVALAGLASPLVYLALGFLKRGRSFFSPPYAGTFLLAYAGVLFWFLEAPNIRFGYGFLLGSLVLAVAPWGKLLLEALGTRRLLAVALLVFVLLGQHGKLLAGGVSSARQYALRPADYPRAASVPCSIENATLLCAKSWRQCGYYAFPCLPKPLPDLEMRGDTPRSGFRRP